MASKEFIIAPDDKCLDDITVFTLPNKVVHTDIAKKYAYSKNIKNVTEGYNDLAALNYIVLFNVNDFTGFFGGMMINDNQVDVLRELFDFYYGHYEDLDLELCKVDKNKKIYNITSGFKSIDDLLEYGYKIEKRKEDINVRKKIRS